MDSRIVCERPRILIGEMSDGHHLSLRQAVSQYVQALVAATVPSPQGRLIPDVYGALLLSRAADELYRAIAEAHDEMSLQMVPATGLPSILRLEHSDSPDGPWEPIPNEAVRVRAMSIRKGDPPVAAFGASMRASLASGFPANLWNALQAAKPGGDHNRYRPGDLVSQQDFELAASAERLLALVSKDGSSPMAGPSDSRHIGAAKIVVLIRPSPQSPPRDANEGTGSQESGTVQGECVFQLCGEMWKLRYRGNEAFFPHRPKSGFFFIRELIRNQGKHLFAVDVAAVVADGNQRGSMCAGDAVLDEQARLALRKRYSERKNELETAERHNDEGTVISARNEMEELEAQVRESYGLGGRDRRMGDEVEKAAKRVSMAVDRAIKQIEKHSQPLANHLRNSLKMGRFMSYRPEEDISWVS